MLTAKQLKTIDPEIQKRIAIEKQIVESAVRELLSHGVSLIVDDGGELIPAKGSSTDTAVLFDGLMNTDIDTLIVVNTLGKRIGGILFVYGNSGWDVIADYNVNLGPFLSETNALADKLENESL